MKQELEARAVEYSTAWMELSETVGRLSDATERAADAVLGLEVAITAADLDLEQLEGEGSGHG